MTTGDALVVRGDAHAIPLPDASIDLIVTSPPYFALRSYVDGGEHYDGQIGSEATPQEFLEALWAVTAECARVLKPTGSMFVDSGDKYAGSGSYNNATLSERNLPGQGRKAANRAAYVPDGTRAQRTAPEVYNKATIGGARPKSLMLLPERYRIGAVDRLGLIAREVIVWNKPNGIPESVRDRARRCHEDWVHLTKQGAYFAAVDEIREPHTGNSHASGPRAAVTEWQSGQGTRHRPERNDPDSFDPRGKLPGSVWTIPSEPLLVPAWAKEKLNLPDHFAAFPQEWPRRLIRGWSPGAICTECGQGRAPVVERTTEYRSGSGRSGRLPKGEWANDQVREGHDIRMGPTTTTVITGYACACPTPTAPSRPAVVLDPFGGTGTVAMVARSLGRLGISLDLSHDYSRLARWRIFDSGHATKSVARSALESQGGLGI